MLDARYQMLDAGYYSGRHKFLSIKGMPCDVMPDLIRHPGNSKLWIPAFAGMTLCAHIYVFYYRCWIPEDDRDR